MTRLLLAVSVLSIAPLLAADEPAAAAGKTRRTYELNHLDAHTLATWFAPEGKRAGERAEKRRLRFATAAIEDAFQNAPRPTTVPEGPVQGPSGHYLQVAQARPGEQGGALSSFLPEEMEPPVALPNQNAVMARGTMEALDEFAELLAQLDVPVKQINTRVDLVTIPSRIVGQAGIDFAVDNGSFRGNVFAQPPGAQTYLAYATGTMASFASAGLRRDTSTVIDSASVTSPSGSPAAIAVGKVTPYFAPMVTFNAFGQRTVDYDIGTIFTGIELWVLPRAHGDDMITVLLRASFIDSVGAVTSPLGTQIPITASVSQAAQVTVKSGQTICIGGLTRMSDSHSSFIAGLGRVAEQERTDALLYVTPKIVRTVDATRGR